MPSGTAGRALEVVCAGELQHAFMQTPGGWGGGERFIGHFLWEYACHFPDRHQLVGQAKNLLQAP